MEGLLSKKMLFFSELMLCSHGVYYWELSPELELLYSSCQKSDVLFSFLSADSNFNDLAEFIRAVDENPVILTSAIGLSWIVTKELIGHIPCRVHILGPVFTADTSQKELSRKLQEKNYPAQFLQQFQEQLQEIPILGADTWIRCGIMLHYSVTGIGLEVSDFRYLSTSKIHSDNESDLPTPGTNIWYAEQQLMNMIENGQVNYKKAFSKLFHLGSSLMAGTDRNSIRQGKNYTTTMIALATRAAARGGLDVGLAYHLGEVYCRQIENATSIPELSQIWTIAFDDFVQRVHKVKEATGLSSAIQTCYGYIEMHLAEKITISNLAALVGYSDSYLAQKFISETGKSVSQYVNEQRVEQAKLRLRGSTDSVQVIGESLGFCNTSYFIRTFREAVGMSPKEYRG